MQNECLELTARWPLRQDDLLGALQPHDIVTIPELADESASLAGGQRHRRLGRRSADRHRQRPSPGRGSSARSPARGRLRASRRHRTERCRRRISWSSAVKVGSSASGSRPIATSPNMCWSIGSPGTTQWRFGRSRRPATSAGTIMLVTLPSPGSYELRVTATAPGYNSSESIIRASVT